MIKNVKKSTHASSRKVTVKIMVKTGVLEDLRENEYFED